MSDHKHEAEQEQIELAEREAHEDGVCNGIPFCSYCLDERDIEDMASYVNEQLDKEKRRA